jgi:hypothetical protein
MDEGMIKEEFVTFELAKKLKEKGFKEKVNAYYGMLENLFDVHPALDMNDSVYRASAPTISQVLKWLREEKEVDLVIEPIYFFDKNKHREYSVRIFAPPLNKPVHCGYFSTWEETALSGIEYVIDNLI